MSDATATNLIAGPVMLALGLFAVFVLIPIGIDEPGGVAFRALSPSYWPRIVAMMLAAFGALVTVRTLIQLKAGGEAGEAAPDDDRTPLKTAIMVALMFVLYFALEPLGFPLTGALALITLMVLAGEYRIAIILPVAVGVPAGLYLFFTKAAYVPIPAGVLEPLLVGG